MHHAHLCAALDAREGMALDKVVLVPAAQAPLKPGAVHAEDTHRLAMLRLALEGIPGLELCDYEMRRGGVSYTVETVRYLRQVYPHERLFWIIGADQLPRLPLWHKIGDLVRLLEFICLDRPRCELEIPAIPGLRLHRCPGHLLDISSTEIRDRAARGLPLDCLMPAKALGYLREHRLYGV